MAGALGDLIPLIIFFIIVGVGGFVGYHVSPQSLLRYNPYTWPDRSLMCVSNLQVYLVINDIGNTSKQKMEKKNIAFTKDGMKVGVKEVKVEDYADKTQR